MNMPKRSNAIMDFFQKVLHFLFLKKKLEILPQSFQKLHQKTKFLRFLQKLHQVFHYKIFHVFFGIIQVFFQKSFAVSFPNFCLKESLEMRPGTPSEFSRGMLL